jgi:hypothetical protein
VLHNKEATLTPKKEKPNQDSQTQAGLNEHGKRGYEGHQDAFSGMVSEMLQILVATLTSKTEAKRPELTGSGGVEEVDTTVSRGRHPVTLIIEVFSPFFDTVFPDNNNSYPLCQFTAVLWSAIAR